MFWTLSHLLTSVHYKLFFCSINKQIFFFLGLNQINDVSLSSSYIVNLQEELGYVIEANPQEYFNFGKLKFSTNLIE